MNTNPFDHEDELALDLRKRGYPRGYTRRQILKTGAVLGLSAASLATLVTCGPAPVFQPMGKAGNPDQGKGTPQPQPQPGSGSKETKATMEYRTDEHTQSGDPAAGTCVLGSPKNGLTGTYDRRGRIRFDARPVQEWAFMATGTGVTGLAVNFPAEMIVQINHAAAIDEQGRLRVLARLHLDLAGAPFEKAKRFRMEHDLRRSVITALAETDEGLVRVDIRAHVEHDVIRIDIDDRRTTPGQLTVRLEEDAPSSAMFNQETGLCLWHENDAAKIMPPKPENAASGSGVMGDNREWLAGRTFGLCVCPGQQTDSASGQTLQLPPAAHHTIDVLGLSTLGGYAAFAGAVAHRLTTIRAESQDTFIGTHEAWWKAFWAQSSFEPGGEDGTMTRYKAAFDLYRYYLACCSNEQRETPVRFQIDLFRYHSRDFEWLTGLICAVEQYQSFYGAMRTGNAPPLRNLASFYAQKLLYYRYYARWTYGHDGARIPMWQTPLLLRPGADPATATPPAGVPNIAYNGENPAGALWVLLLLCDYVDLSGDSAFLEGTLRPLAADLVEFVRLQYPQRENGWMVIAPCNAGETWQGVRDPAEMVCALRVTLPRLIALAQAQHWGSELITRWEEMLAAVPAIPRGRLDYRDPATPPVILPGDQLAPAADMSACQAYVLAWSKGQAWYQLNSQHTELYAIWPAKLVLRDEASRDSARRSYRERLWPHLWDGWNLDVVFAACLGLHDEVARWFDEHFDHTYVLPCGLARETAPENPQVPGLPECPSLQGMGTGVIPVLEMLLQDYPDELIVLPCWPQDIPVDYTLYSPYVGKVEVHYWPKIRLEVKTGRDIRVSTPLAVDVVRN